MEAKHTLKNFNIHLVKNCPFTWLRSTSSTICQKRDGDARDMFWL